jgi:GNAT superfamily N-acetyltransferase
VSSEVRLVPATVEQIGLLRDLTYRAKASWGYDAEFMALIYSDIDLTPEMFERDTLMTAVEGDRVLGYAQLMPIDRTDTLYLENLYVDPDAQGKGIGRHLIEWAFSETARQGYDWLEWDSDPNAAPFYVRMGGEKVGEMESTIRLGRMIPKFRKRVRPD